MSQALGIRPQPGDEARMIALDGDAERALRWFFHHPRPAAGSIGAAAIEGSPPPVVTWSFVVEA